MAEHFGAGSPEAFRVPRHDAPAPGPQRAPDDHHGSTHGRFGERLRTRFGEHVTNLTGSADNEHKAGAKRHLIGKLDQYAKVYQRQSGLLLGTALGLVRDQFRQHMDRLGHDQKMFQLTARVQRGDLHGMTHQELRDVRDYPQKYGGEHAQQIFASAHAELHRREGVRQYEKRNIRLHNIGEDAAVRRVQEELASHQRILHGANEAAAARRNASLKEQQRSEHHSRRAEAKWDREARQKPTGVGAAANRVAPNHAGPVPAPGQVKPGQHVMYSNTKKHAAYVQGRNGKKHYLGKKILARKAAGGARPAGQRPLPPRR